MSTTYHIEATAESVVYHGVELDGEALTAVAVGPRVAQATADPRLAFVAALAQIASGNYWLLELAALPTGWEVASVHAVAREFAVAPGAIDLAQWLEQRRAGFDEAAFYGEGGDPDAGVDAERVRAFDLVGAAASWPAPIPQKLGLVALLRHAIPVQAVLVLTDDKDAPPPTAFVVQEAPDGTFHITRDGVTWVSNLLAPYAAPDGLPADETFFLEDGRLREADEDSDLAALIAAIEADGAARMWSWPALIALTGDGADLIEAPLREAWRKAALTALFDIILAGLVMPVSAELGQSGRRSRVQTQFEGLLRAEIAATDPDRALAIAEDAGRAIFTEVCGQVRENGILEVAAHVYGGDGRFAPALTEVPENAGPMPLGEVRTSLAESLDPLATHLASESGAARIVLALIDMAIARLVAQQNLALASIDLSQLARARSALGSLLTERFDTMAALRADAGAEVSCALLADEPSVAAAQALLGINWMREVFAPAGPTAHAARSLRAFWIAPARLPQELAHRLPPWPALDPTWRHAEPSALFRPDPAPQRLPLRLLPKLDPTLAETIARRTRGIGVLVATDAEGDQPTHASLCGLRDLAPAAVRPELPGASNGAVQMFVPYAGLPLASPNVAGSRHDPENAGATPEEAFAHIEADYTAVDLPQVPPLAYGHAYGLRGYWIANSGALPAGVRGDDPFTPGRPADTFRPQPQTPYLRRTAISPTSLSEPDRPPRLGRVPPDVAPLALDAPRLGLGALGAGSARWIDLWRLADGTGALTGAAAGQELRFPGAELDGLAITALRLCLCTPQGEAADLALTGTEGGLQARLPDPMPGPLPHGAWLRLTVADTSGRVHFDPPEIDGVPRPVDPPPLLLLAPESAGFRPGFGPARLRAQAPGVSFSDFDAFASNGGSLAALTGDSASPLLRVLRRARAVFEAIGEGDMVDLLDRLPDPAVSALVVTLDPLDRLDPGVQAEAWGGVVPQTLELAPYRGLEALLAPIDGEDAGQALASALASADPSQRKGALDRFRDVVRAIHCRAGFDIDVAASSADGAPDLRANALGDPQPGVVVKLPAGRTARLHVAPKVPEALWDDLAILDPGLQTLAQARLDGGLLFEGAAITLEAMAPATTDEVAAAPFAVEPEGTARAYRLVCRPDATLRRFASVDLDTQRWRPTGLPIYDWVAPARPDQACPIAPVDRTAEVQHFENQAFAGRGRDDGEGLRLRIPTATRRGPALGAVELRREDGPPRAAGWLRHRVRLRSRYAGALATVPAVDLAGRVGDWNFSVAILADPGGPGLTRPQLRAILPLPDRIPDRPDATPPLLAVLDEPPMAHLGLAERILAEIGTTRRFGFVDAQLALSELRKEVGPDPRLTHVATQAAPSRAMTLQVEGPFGLTFDQPTAPAPRFTGSQVLLHLDSGDEPLVEESFVAVSFSRVAAPGWVWPVDPDPGAAATVPLSDNRDVLEDAGGALVTVADGAVRLRENALFADPSHAPPKVELCRVGPDARLVCAPAGGDSRRIMVLGRDRVIASALLAVQGEAELVGPAERAVLSPPTVVEWARTAREVGRLMVNDTPLRIDDPAVAIVRDATSGRLHFRRDGQVAMVRSPSMAGPVPLGVHRHLAILATRPSDALGRARQLFAEARLADFMGFCQIAPDAPGLRVMEFEVPARALLSQNGSDAAELEGFKRPWFDLAATARNVARGWPAGLRLALRAVTRGFGADEPIRLTLTDDEGAQVALGFRPGFPTSGLIVQGSGSDWQVWVQSVTGLEPAQTLQVAPTDAALADDRFALALATDATAEIWCDVSLLHGGRAVNEPYPQVDFDWFFGPARTEPLAQEVASAALQDMPEAQARILGLTADLRIAS